MPVNGSPLETIAINDRGLAYGDGLFETIRLHRHQPVLLDRHLDRLASGAERLGIACKRDKLEQEISQLSPEFPDQGVLKIIVTRGTGGRGYVPGNISEPSRILSLHAMPDYGDNDPVHGIGVFVCRQRLAQQPALAGIKHLNRLEQVLASLEWPDASFMEGLMLDTADNVIEGTRSNLFWAESGQLLTPSLANCGVTGIMRNYLMEKIGNVTEIAVCNLARLCAADEVFFCNSIFGIWPVGHLVSGDTRVSYPPEKRLYSVKGAELFNALLSK